MHFFSNKARSLFIIFIVVCLSVTGFVSCKFRTVDRYEETREMMGTYITVIVYGDEDTAAEAIGAAFIRLGEIGSIASIYDEDSEATELNTEGSIESPSREFSELIELSVYYYNISGGSFDITISPVLDLWREGLWKETKEVQAEKIEETLKLVGSDKIVLEDEKIYFGTGGMSIDLGGIAKGYAVDEALKTLSGLGIKNALINAGGDIGTIGTKPDGGGWLVELDNPFDDDEDSGTEESLPGFIIEEMAVATSGNYYRYYDPEKKVHHITDPLTGYSANECISVTVIASNCTEADVLATSVFVKGPVEGMELIEEIDGVEALIIDNERNIYMSTGLSKYMK
ncbi:MAG: FAD:protein FMN transferase [Actinomycetota bacterium]|nr:MAG: FAD:protein FMN transferase [Actinomycetota bacterium]